MKNLKVWQKLALMGVVFMIPFAVVTWRLVSSVNTLGVEFARKEAKGADYYAPLLVFLQEMQQRRGLAYALLSGDASLRDRLAAKTTDVERAVQAVSAADQRLGADLRTTAKWTELKQAALELLGAPAAPTAAESFQRHTKVIDATVTFISLIGDNSNLTLDPDLDSYYLMDLLIFKGPVLADFLGQARGLGSGIAAAGRATPEQLARLGELTTLADYVAAQADDALAKALAQNTALAPALASLRRASDTGVREALDFLRRTVADRGTTLKAPEYFVELTRRIDPLYLACQRANTELVTLLDARVARLHRSVWLTLGSAGLGLVLVSAIGFYIMRDITRPLSRMVASAGDIASGRLPDLAADPRRDELGDLSRAFARMSVTLRELAAVARRIAEGDVAVEVRPQSADDVMGGALAEMVGQLREVAGVATQIADGNLTVTVQPRSARDAMGSALATMVQRLSALVGQVQKSSIQVNTSATEIAATSRQQQTTATEIAATTTEIGATSHEIAATSRELVKTVGEVAQTAGQTGRIADEGRTGLTRMEQTMTHVSSAVGDISGKLAVLSQKAGNISSVVTTIAKVADQTNLLSLNAAIEAEKAGEFGRGFAVVAQEVRRLADQTAVASSDIGEMVREMQSAVSAGVMGMEKFSDDVRRAVEEVRTVGAQLAQIIGQVQALTPRFATVNEGMQAQATGAQQISEALAQLGDAARQTAESLRQSTDVIQSLNDATTGLRTGIGQFRIAV